MLYSRAAAALAVAACATEPSPRPSADPCGPLERACIAAGHVEANDLRVSCMMRVVGGTPVPNVTVDADVLSACARAQGWQALAAKGGAQPTACTPLVDACKGAGYFFGGAMEHKGLLDDCFHPLLNGGVIANVHVSDADLKACRAAGGRP